MDLRVVRKDFTTKEEIANSVTHGIGTLLGIAGLILLGIKSAHMDSPVYTFSVLTYGITLVILYINSTLYHGFPPGKTKNIFEKLDHSSVYLLIAGTYTPFTLIAIGGSTGITICMIQWALAITGITLKFIWIDRFVLLHVLIYLGMGWTIIFFGPTIIQSLNSLGFIFLLIGGLSYSIGVLFYVFDWFKYHHLVWHIFVVVASIFLFFSIYMFLD